MPYKSLCIQIGSRAWLGRQIWRQWVGLAFLMLHTGFLQHCSACPVSVGLGTSRVEKTQTHRPTACGKQQGEGWAGDHLLEPLDLGCAERRPKMGC